MSGFGAHVVRASLDRGTHQSSIGIFRQERMIIAKVQSLAREKFIEGL